MLMVCDDTSVPLMVRVAVREVAPVLAEAVTFTVPSLEPDDGETVSHEASLLPTVQLVLEAIVNDCCSPAAEKSIEVVEMYRAGVSVAATCCVMLTVRDDTPDPLTVTVAVREEAPVLAAAVMVTVPLFEPLAGETVSHEASLPTSQLVFELMLNDCCSPAAEKSRDVTDTVRAGVAAAASCVMLIVFDDTPVPLTTTVVVLWVAPVLTAAVNLTVPSLAPDDGETVSHEALLRTFQLMLALTVRDCCSPAELKLNGAVDTSNDGVNASCVMLTVLDPAPRPITVTVAVRDAAPVLAAAVTVTAPLPEPSTGETVSHAGSLLLTIQLVLDVISNGCCPADDIKRREAVDTVSDGMDDACATLMDCASTPALLTVMVAVRSAMDVLAAAVTVTVPSLAPEEGEIVSQDEPSLPTVQFVFEVMVKVFCSPEAEKFNEAIDTDSAGTAPS